MKWMPWIILIINVLTFLLYGWDKLQAVRNERAESRNSRSAARSGTAHRRVPERRLLLLTALGGSIGALIAMRLFRHKIRKPKFSVGVPVIFALHVMAVLYFVHINGGWTGLAERVNTDVGFNILHSDRVYTDADFGIETFHSANDMDGDGIDDQSDILSGVRAYLDTEPKYKSVYYVGGWPDDGYGVCTDVVARGFLAAGYNLQELVDADVRANPGDYVIDKPDSNIDFRRVRNLQVYFGHTLQILTCDPKEIEEWQGGDIVIWKNHIGIISDRRRKDGVCYVLHHGSPTQLAYEQDVLEARGEILGHYRVW